MELQIKNGFDKILGGKGKLHDQNKSYGQEIIGLLDMVWPKIRENNVTQNGINIAVYDPDETIFAGVEMSEADATRCGLDIKHVKLPRYGYARHIGPYSQLGQTYGFMENEMKRLGFKPAKPILEIYGHWTDDESKLETELVYSFSENK